MAQQLNTLLNFRYEVSSPDVCYVTSAGGIHLCTARPGAPGLFCGDGKPVALSSENAVMYPIAKASAPVAWQHTVISSPATSLSLRNMMIYQAGTLEALTLEPAVVEDELFCEICFTSGSAATVLIAPADWKWFGDHISNAAFVPQMNTRYRLVILSDGEFIRAAAEGVAI